MSNSVSCPFCGETFYKKNFNGHHMHPAKMADDDCPLSGCAFSEQQWNMRPPKKEVGHTPAQGEVEWLRALVKELISKPPVIQITEPSKDEE